MSAIGSFIGQAATQANAKYDVFQAAVSRKLINGTDRGAIAASFSGPVASAPVTCP